MITCFIFDDVSTSANVIFKSLLLKQSEVYIGVYNVMNHFARVCSATGRRSSRRVNQVESDQAVGMHYTAQEEENAEEPYS